MLIAEALLAPLRSNGRVERSDHLHTHAEGGLGGFIFRLIAGGLALGGMLVHKLFWLPLRIPPGLTFALSVGMTVSCRPLSCWLDWSLCSRATCGGV